MADEEVKETVFGKHNRYEVVKINRALEGIKYIIRKNGAYHRGTFSSLSAAVEAAGSDAKKEG